VEDGSNWTDLNVHYLRVAVPWDIAYHRDKYRRGFATLIDLWGADHGGYVKRMQAAVRAISEDRANLDIKIYQFVNLFDGGEPVRMSKRAGTFVTLREVVDDVGKDVFRFIMLTRRNDQALDFDFAKVTEQSKDNPVFYVQYAHARAASVMRHAAAQLPHLAAIVTQHRDLIKKLETSHFEAVLNGDLDSRYFESCRKTVEQEAALGIDARFRSTAGNHVLRETLDALARKHKFSQAKLVDGAKLVSQVLAFDVANAMTLHREAAERKRQERRQVIDAAIAEFAAHGLHGTTMTRIAERAGINKERLYNYFGDKGGLLAAVYLRSFERLDIALMQAFTTTKEGPDPLQAIIAASLDFATENASVCHLISAAEANVHPLVQHARRKRFERMAAGWGNTPESRLIARSVVSMLEGAVLDWLDAPTPDRVRTEQVLYALLWSGLRGLTDHGIEVPR